MATETPKDFEEFRKRMLEIVNKLEPGKNNCVMFIAGEVPDLAAGMHGSAYDVAAGIAHILTSRPPILAAMFEHMMLHDMRKGNYETIKTFATLMEIFKTMKEKKREPNPLDHDCDNCDEQGKCPIEDKMREANTKLAEEAPTAGNA